MNIEYPLTKTLRKLTFKIKGNQEIKEAVILSVEHYISSIQGEAIWIRIEIFKNKKVGAIRAFRSKVIKRSICPELFINGSIDWTVIKRTALQVTKKEYLRWYKTL